MSSCDECGLMFENIHDFQRHVKNWCPERQPPAKRLKLAEEAMPEQQLTTDAELSVFRLLAQKGKEKHADDARQKVEKYID